MLTYREDFVVNSKLEEVFSDLPPFLNLDRVSELFNLQRTTVYRWVVDKQIQAYKLGGTWFVLATDLKEKLEEGSNLDSDHVVCEELSSDKLGERS